jgi:UDPglucose 6-dehydrogenase
LKQCKIPIYEPDLEQLVRDGIESGRLRFDTALDASVGKAEAVFIAVGTPSRRGDAHADLGYVHAAAREIAVHLDNFTVIVTKSTVPVGTGDQIERIVHETNPTADFAVASNPEFLREGAAIRDFRHPDRIVVGTEDERARKVMGDIYRPPCLNQAPIMYAGPPN